LIGNKHLSAEQNAYYRALARLLVHESANTPILVDWTTLTDGHRALVAAIPVGGRAVPILCEVHEERAHATIQVERSFLERLRQILPETCSPVLVADAGFRSDWILDAQELGFDHVTRVAGYVMVRVNGGWVRSESLSACADESATDLGRCQVAKTRCVGTRLVGSAPTPPLGCAQTPTR
jgi:hypothetical protein